MQTNVKPLATRRSVVKSLASLLMPAGALPGVSFGQAVPAEILEETVVFSARTGYPAYRIPALVVSQKGTILAFIEGRASSSDTGDINVVLRRSTDGGKTWGAIQTVADRGSDTVGNPCAVVDRATGRIHLLLSCNPGNLSAEKIVQARLTGSENSRSVWYTFSDDDGGKWAPLREITKDVKLREWTWYATGPGVGIQLKGGRLVVPCDHRVSIDPTTWCSHVIFSDDNGQSWKLGGTAPSPTDEAQIVELADGRLMLSMRNYANRGRRATATSNDSGATWSALTFDQSLPDPVCEGSILRWQRQGHSAPSILFANPANEHSRENLTIRLSEDNGATWKYSRTLYDSKAAYSCLCGLPDGRIACLYERWGVNPNQIVLAIFNMAWLTSSRLTM